MKKEAIKFLEAVWMDQPQGRYACVAWKDGNLWKQKFLHRDDIDRAWQNRGRDLYFCPNLFSKPHRTNECATASRWLFADLDEVDPRSIEERLAPTIWWETSEGRFQALWKLLVPLSPDAHSKLNQHLTYYLHADLNGWPLSKVLRVPGSVSTKWGSPWKIRDGITEDLVYDPRELWKIVKDVEVPAHSDAKFEVPKASRTLARQAPPEVRRLLRRRYVQDRSQHVYLIAKMLRERGWQPDKVAAVLMTSPVAQDKYGGRLKREVVRVCEKIGEDDVAVHAEARKARKKRDTNGGIFHVQGLNRFLAKEIVPPGWLVGDIWSNEAHGIIVGEQKTYKSMFVQDLAVSIATGTDFLNHFPVPQDKVGPVIYVQEENPESMVQDRFLKICLSRGLHSRRGRLPEDVPIHVVNNAQVDLTSDDHLEELQRLIREHDSKLLILDPFYLMTPGVDENSAVEVIPILKSLLRIKQASGCGVLIVHHYNKGDKKNPFNQGDEGRISGTGVFGRWYESLLMVERGEELGQVKLYARHRMAAPQPPVVVDFDMGDMGDYRYEPKVTEIKTEIRDFYDEVKTHVLESPGISVAALAKKFEMRTETLRRRLEKSTHFRLEVIANRSPMVYLRGESEPSPK